MALHHARVTDRDTEPQRWLCIVHGILGCGGNWRSFARSLVQQDPALGVLLVDLRHHGRSGPQDGDRTMAACAQDLESTFASLEIWPLAVAGHSFGGKVVLAWAERSERPPAEVWVLDSPPGLRNQGGDPGERLIGAVLEAMESIDLPAQDRPGVIEDLVSRGVPLGVSTWLTTNLRMDSDAGGYIWRLDLNAIRELLLDYFQLDGWPLVESIATVAQVHLVRGAVSDRWTESEWRQVTAASSSENIFTHVVEDAGHWLHVDNPSGLTDALRCSPFFSGMAIAVRIESRPGSEGQ
jgi:esterase